VEKIQCSTYFFKTVEKGKLKITFNGNGVVNMDMISLFPQETWNNRKWFKKRFGSKII
jgi:hypothetical protein